MRTVRPAQRHPVRPAWLLVSVAAAALIAGCAGRPASGGVACASLPGALAALPGLQISQASDQPADSLGHPAHCRVTGLINPRRGAEGRSYAIGFEMRLPQGWNKRFLHQVNGGNDGVVKSALGDLGVLSTDALSRGFAVISSDSGHNAEDTLNHRYGLARGNAFGLDPQARRDYGYSANGAVWTVAQALIEGHYGEKPLRNYMAGCSNGGRHGMVAASRYAERYDGILAGAPGFNLPKAAVQHAWDIQQWQRVDSDIRRAFSPADMQLVADRVLARCDGLDLLVDSMVTDIQRCQSVFRLAELQCSGAKTASCLSAAQVQALTQSLAGPRNSRGEALYADWPFDAGMGAAGWRTWKLESSVAPWDRNPIIATLGAGSLAYVFSTPPVRAPGTPAGLLDYLARFDFDRDAPKIFANDALFTESAVSLMSPADADDPHLTAFAQRGGKMLVYHGASDPVFSVNDSTRWVERLQHNLGPQAAGAVARVFVVPGMGHCQGGPATDQFDALGALVSWVEGGKPPERIEARTHPANKELPAAWSAQRARPLCPWPQVARYAGGDVEAAASFRCAAP
jgi:pimeloyl-ACP methyl ester carboxylesterase